jgi:nucleoside-diphosphate-sugar epimerase
MNSLPKTPQKILITGGSGYLGKLLARELLSSGHQVILPVRSLGTASFIDRAAGLKNELGNAAQEMVTIVPLDIASPNDIRELPTDVDFIVHCAAVTRFNVEEDLANQVNRDSSRHLFEHARSCPQLKGLFYVSTVYAAGDQEGHIPEERLDSNRGFANHYERSKWETENLLQNDFRDLPWRILRVATVLCDDESGKTGQFNAVHNTLKLFYYGLISLIPGKEDTPVYLVTGEFVTKAIARAIFASNNHEIMNIVHDQNESLTLRQLIDQAFEVFLEDEKFKARNTQKPLFVDEESFNLAADGIKGFGGSVLVEALGSVAPFAKQLFITKDFANDNMRRCYPEAHAPEPRTLLAKLIRNLIATRWGRS